MGGDATRCFLALTLPAGARAGAAEVGDALRARIGEREVKWVDPENLHITLRFFGDLDPDAVESAAALVRQQDGAFDAPPTRWASVGAFQSPRRVQVIWLGLEDPDRRLDQLAAEVNRALEAAGFGRADKPFKSHVTLGRVRRGRRVSFERLSERLTIPATGFSISGIALMKSVLTPQGPVYTPLETAAARR